MNTSNDPAGFSFGDVLQYGAVGHIVAIGSIVSNDLAGNKDSLLFKLPFVQLVTGTPFDEVDFPAKLDGY